jgi:hypothetical protein
MDDDNQEIPLNATIRQEYVKYRDPDCKNSHGPYFYAYWKQDKKLKKRYVGKNLEDFGLRKIAKEIKVKPSQLIKLKFIQQEATKGNLLAKQYVEKLRKEEVSIDWTHPVLINSIREQRMLKMMAITDDRHFSYQNEVELNQFIASEMQKEGLDLNNEENLKRGKRGIHWFYRSKSRNSIWYWSCIFIICSWSFRRTGLYCSNLSSE